MAFIKFWGKAPYSKQGLKITPKGLQNKISTNL